jgi:hypothetical protein
VTPYTLADIYRRFGRDVQPSSTGSKSNPRNQQSNKENSSEDGGNTLLLYFCKLLVLENRTLPKKITVSWDVTFQ